MFGLSDNKDQNQDSQGAQYGGELTDTSMQPQPQAPDINGYGGDYTSAPPSPSIPPTAPVVTDNTPADSLARPAEPPTPVPPPTIKMDRPFASSPPANPPAKDTAAHNDIPIMSPHSDDDLLKMKQQALQSLAPLIDHLEQTPEEKFKTTMMLIQASDNAELVKEAFDAANQIPDEKARAQALLDVVNEINYFTHQDTGSGGQEAN